MSDSSNWYERDTGLNRVFENSEGVSCMPDTINDILTWIERMELMKERLTQNSFTLFISTLKKRNKLVLLDLAKEEFAKRKLLTKNTFNHILRELDSRHTNKKGRTKKKNDDDGKRGLNAREISYGIMKKMIISNPSEYLKETLIYRKGFWIVKSMDFLNRAILRYFEWNQIDFGLSDSQLMTKLRAVRTNILSETSSSIFDFDKDFNLIGVINGVIDISDLNNIRLLKHDPQFKIRIKFPLKYNPNAECPNISKIVRDTLGKENEEHYYKALGDTLYGDPTRFEKVEVWVGEPDTGKTTLLRIVEAFLGKIYVAHQSLNDVVNDRFTTAELDGKRANIYAEVSGGFLKNPAHFNVVVSEEILKGNKKYGLMYNFRNRTHHWFACNKLPQLNEIPPAVMKRVCLIHCTNKIKLEDRIDKFEETLLTEEEMSGLLNKALMGYKTLRKDGHYNNRFYENVEEQWIKYSNPFFLFMEKYLEYFNHNGINELYEINKNQLLNVYNLYLKGLKLATLNGTNILTKKINRLKEFDIGARDYQRNNIKYHVYTHIKFNDKAIEVFNIKKENEEEEDIKLDINQKSLDMFENNGFADIIDIEKDKVDYSDEGRYA